MDPDQTMTTRDVLRWVLLIAGLPIWWPFVKTLWRDFSEALREEGGLLGSPPTATELERMRKQRPTDLESGLHSEPIVRPGDVRHRRLRSSAPTRSGAPTSRPRGFR